LAVDWRGFKIFSPIIEGCLIIPNSSSLNRSSFIDKNSLMVGKIKIQGKYKIKKKNRAEGQGTEGVF